MKSRKKNYSKKNKKTNSKTNSKKKIKYGKKKFKKKENKNKGKIKKRYSKKKKSKSSSRIKNISLAIAVSSFIYVVVFFIFFTIGKMDGYSMLPNLNNKNVVIINKHQKINRFDLVYFRNPNKKNEYYIRRVIGIPGDKIDYRDDELFINNEGKSEPYLNEKKKMVEPINLTDDFSLTDISNVNEVPSNNYFLMGDNRKSTVDSREFGFISEEDIIGKVVMKLTPIYDIKIY